MNVESIMTTDVFTVRMDDTIGTIHGILKKAEFHHLLVVDGRRLVGVISDRDALKAISPFLGTVSESQRDVAILGRKIHLIMSRKLFTVPRTATVEEAARLLIEHRISCLPVVTAHQEVEGVVTWRDILQYIIEKKA